jgi:hypothetical protein
MSYRRAPWRREGDARELIAAVTARTLAPTVFRARFGDDALLDALAGQGVRALAGLLAVEAAAELIPAPADPVVSAASKVRCPHSTQPGVTFDLTRRLAYCDDCASEYADRVDELQAEAVERWGERPESEWNHDRCHPCGDLSEVAPFRILLGARWVEGRCCPTCAAFLTGETTVA